MQLNDRERQVQAFRNLLDIMDELRAKCPWDSEQTFESLRNLTIEETHELAESILNQDMKGIEKELGDLLLHIVFYAKIGSEKGDFDIASVAESLSDKLIFRHPHVFGNVHVNSSAEVKENWEEIKMKEATGTSVLGGVPNSMPAMIKANRIQEKVKAVGFDWEQPVEIWEKIKEEISEIHEAVELKEKYWIEEEFGDLLFSVINASRLYGVDPETALEKTNRKFIARFNFLENEVKKKGKSIRELKLDELNKIWEQAKKSDQT